MTYGAIEGVLVEKIERWGKALLKASVIKCAHLYSICGNNNFDFASFNSTYGRGIFAWIR
jgi:hypothetical protein